MPKKRGKPKGKKKRRLEDELLEFMESKEYYRDLYGKADGDEPEEEEPEDYE